MGQCNKATSSTLATGGLLKDSSSVQLKTSDLLKCAGGGAHKVTRQDDLVVWYKFNESSGETAADSSGNGYNASLTNMDSSSVWIPGKNGNALEFDGHNDYIVDQAAAGTIASAMNAADVPTPSAAGSQGPWAISFWLKKTSIPPGSAAGILAITTSVGSTGASYVRCRIDAVGTNIRVGFGTVADTPYYIYSDVWAPDGNWHLLTCTFSGTVWKVYRNGDEKNTRTESIYYTVNGADHLFLGNAWPANITKALDDFRIYDVELDSDEVSAIYGDGDGDWG